MRCECSGCTRTFDPDQVERCRGCGGYFCPACWDDHDEVAELMDSKGLTEEDVP